MTFLDFGDMALAGAFLKDISSEKKYPLALKFDPESYAVEVVEPIDPALLFGNYFYHASSSKTARDHFAKYARQVYERFEPESVIEIGCNDGVFLRPMSEFTRAVGVDPSSVSKLVEDLTVVHDYFENAQYLDPADLIVANNVFAHAEINKLTECVRECLKPHGVFVLETHYLGRVLEGQYDVIYHEHRHYHSVISLAKHFQKHGMKVFDVQENQMHGGSIRVFVCKDDREASRAVQSMLARELWRGFAKPETYAKFADSVQTHILKLSSLINKLQDKGYSVSGYGASGRANTLLQACNIKLDFIVDDCVAKHGYLTPGTHIPIVASGESDYVLLTAWTYKNEILPKIKGNVIIPFQEIEVRRAA